ncbi:MAG: hypothetical protein KU38_03720 [Sulfurovum sp. FS08-3]|nr:MAG: hypothetical protein KU38_03720 [Sulfurovum sp. FS08-3]
MITIDNPSLEAQLIAQAQGLRMRVDELVVRLLSTKEIKSKPLVDDEEVQLFSNHSANLIDEWNDSREDEVWK